MGYRTVNHVPSIYTYAQAKQIHDNIVPIRGRGKDTKPLGQRRDGDTYHIRMNGEDVECVLYKTPVVTFHPDDTITVSTDNWNTVSTHQFIWAITGCNCYGSRGKTVIKIGDKEYVINESMKLRHNGGGALKWEVLTKEEQYDWAIDRQKANIVRAKYKEFITFVNGGLKLRTIDTDAVFSTKELSEQFGEHTLPWGTKAVNDTEFNQVALKNSQHAVRFMNLIKEEGNYENYYKAMLMVAGLVLSVGYRRIETERAEVKAKPRSITDKIYECIYKWHSDEIFVRIKLADGKVPTGKYDSWV